MTGVNTYGLVIINKRKNGIERRLYTYMYPPNTLGRLIHNFITL
jgi:hypothetical protein